MELHKAAPNPKAQVTIKNACILAAMWRLVETRVFMCQYPTHDQRLLRRLGHDIREIFQEDQRHKSDTSGADIETLLTSEPPLIQETWYRIKGWYKEANGRAFQPARITTKRFTAEQFALYQILPSPG